MLKTILSLTSGTKLHMINHDRFVVVAKELEQLIQGLMPNYPRQSCKKLQSVSYMAKNLAIAATAMFKAD